MGKKHSYGVVLDAGSSGSRVYIYEYKKASYVREHDDEDELARLPHVKTKKDWNFKVHPGISTFGATPERVGDEHLKELVDFALDKVPSSEVESTPIFLLATAGMRLLPKDQSEAVLEHTCSYLRQRTRFLLPDCGLHIQVIPGETEGLYGWIAANYLLGGFDEPQKHEHGKGHHTYGFLDMGGASAQIAFAPNATEAEKHANDLKLLRLRKVNGEPLEYGVFVTTWLGFGANEARRRYVDHLLETYAGQHELPDPCLPKGILVDQTGVEMKEGSPELNGFQPHLIGTGNFAECLRTAYPLLEKDKACDDPPCLLNGVHTPAIDFDVNHFVGVSEYWHTTHEIFAMAHKDKAYDLQTYQKQVTEFCSRNWSDIEADVAKETWGDKVDAKTVEEVCFKASWLINMLHDGIGVPRVGLESSKSNGYYNNKTNEVLNGAKDRGFLDPFQAVNKIDGTEVSWTLGKMVLYASSQMPPAAGALAVGFGSNIPGSNSLPSDFQLPSTEGRINAGDSVNADNLENSQDWTDTLLRSSYSRRVPGILIFLLILILALYLLCGRERRISIQHKLNSLLHRKAYSSSPRWSTHRRRSKPETVLSLFSSKLLGNSSSHSPDRFLEEGQDLLDADDNGIFELASAASNNSDSNSSSFSTSAPHDRPPLRSTRTTDSSRSTVLRTGTSTPGPSPPSSSGGGIGPASLLAAPFERLSGTGGLAVRAESRDRLGVSVVRRPSSRPGSPRRSMLFPGGSGKESLD